MCAAAFILVGEALLSLLQVPLPSGFRWQCSWGEPGLEREPSGRSLQNILSAAMRSRVLMPLALFHQTQNMLMIRSIIL